MTNHLDDAPGRGIRLAFAGAGHWHFNVDARYLTLAREAGCDIVGLSDDDESIARARAAEAGCPATTDLQALVEQFRPDFVVATPRPDRAPEQIQTLLSLGVPMLAEKPLGLRAAQVWSLVEPAERGWVAVAFPNRLLPIWERLDALDSTLVHLNFKLVKGSPERYRGFGVPWMLDPSIGGGGPLRNFGIHLADLVSWRLGPRAAQVVGASLTHRRYDQAIEDYGVGLLQTADGVVVTIETGYSHASIDGTDFEFRAATSDAYLLQRRSSLEIQPAEGAPEMIQAAPGRNAYRDLFFDTLRRFRRGEPPQATVRDCALANEIVDAMYDAARGGAV